MTPRPAPSGGMIQAAAFVVRSTGLHPWRHGSILSTLSGLRVLRDFVMKARNSGIALYRKEVDTLTDPARQARTRSGKPAQAIKPALQQAMKNLKLLSDGGVAIAVAATGGAARVMKLDGVGTIQPGKWADLLALTADPLADIRNTRQIHPVWIGGQRLPAATK